ncbi:MAG: hypothetical protein Kow00108_01080 [Calditrichia bacterium]
MEAYDIVIIDDDIKLTEILSTLLTLNGYSVKSINDSTLALSYIKKYMPKVVILDLMMPEIDGLKILKSIKDSPELSNVRVLIYSGKAFDVDKRLAISYGADLFLTKPTKAQDILNHIAELIHSVDAH